VSGWFRKSAGGSNSFPESWRRILDSRIPYCGLLDEPEMDLLRELTGTFLRKKRFEGCNGQKIDDEIRITIAGQACLLLLGGGKDVYTGLRTVLVYPETFVSPLVEREGDWIITEGEEARSGEFWSHGTVILSWDDVLFSLSRPRDGYNVVFHEFAHLLDHQTGASEGMEHALYSDAFRRVVQKEYRQFVEATKRRKRTWLDPYGAESPAEFFAVATEFFFERGADLRIRHPRLYQQLRSFYGLDTDARRLSNCSPKDENK